MARNKHLMLGIINTDSMTKMCFIFRSERGLTENIVTEISKMKEEPQWMLDFRLKH